MEILRVKEVIHFSFNISFVIFALRFTNHETPAKSPITPTHNALIGKRLRSGLVKFWFNCSGNLTLSEIIIVSQVSLRLSGVFDM